MVEEKKAEAAKEIKARLKQKIEEEKRKEEKIEAKEGKKAEVKKEEKPKEEKKEEAKKEEAPLEEKVLTLSLRDAWKSPRPKRAKAAVRVLKEQLERHLKKPVKLDVSINKAIWKRGITNPPRKLKLRAKIFKEFARVFVG